MIACAGDAIASTTGARATAPSIVGYELRRDFKPLQSVIDYNTALATVCAQYANCRTDGNLVFEK